MFGRPWTEFGAGPRLAGAGDRCALGAGFAALFAGGALCGAGGGFFCWVCWVRAKDEAMSKTRMALSFTRTSYFAYSTSWRLLATRTSSFLITQRERNLPG